MSSIDSSHGIESSSESGWLKPEWKRKFNVVGVGVCFMLIFTSFQTTVMMSANVITTLNNNTNSSFSGNAFISTSVIYVVFALTNWFVPSLVMLIGTRISMFTGGICYLFYILQYLWPITAVYYATSALVGVGAAIIWTAQGTYMTENSTKATMSLHSGIFWALLQSSLLFGNMFEFFELRGSIGFSHEQITNLFIVFSAVCGGGVLLLIALRKSPPNPEQDVNNENNTSTIVQTLVDTWKLFLTPNMLLFCVTFAYSGLELTYFSGIYTNCVGRNKHLNDAKSAIGLSGMLLGVGEILGGLLFGIIGTIGRKYGRNPIVLMSFVIQIGAYFLSFMFLPDHCVMHDSDDKVYFQPELWMALLNAFLLGFADACLNTQIYATIGSVYQQSSTAGFAIFKFTQSLFAAIAFFYGSYLVLKWQLLILAVTAMMSTLAFFAVQIRSRHLSEVVNERRTLVNVDDGDAF